MEVFLIIIHVICCIGLIAIVLLQAGKGAGLASTFGAQAVESALGAGASDFLKRGTSIMAVVFMLTSLSLAFVTAKKSASVMKNVKPTAEESSVTRRVTQTPTGENVVEEKLMQGLKGKSKEELQKVLKEITQKLPLGQKVKEGTQTSGTDATPEVASGTTAQEGKAGGAVEEKASLELKGEVQVNPASEATETKSAGEEAKMAPTQQQSQGTEASSAAPESKTNTEPVVPAAQ